MHRLVLIDKITNSPNPKNPNTQIPQISILKSLNTQHPIPKISVLKNLNTQYPKSQYSIPQISILNTPNLNTQHPKSQYPQTFSSTQSPCSFIKAINASTASSLTIFFLTTSFPLYSVIFPTPTPT